MKFKTSDFSGYMETCATIRAIKELVKDREFSFEEIHKIFPVATSDKFIQYLNEDLIKSFLEHLFGSNYFNKRHDELNDIAEKLNSKISQYDYEKSKYAIRFEHLTSDEQNLNILDRNIRLIERWENELSKGEVFRFLEIIFNQSFKSQSYLTTNSVMSSGLSIALETFNFKEDEFSKIMKNFNFGYWGGNSIEYYYAQSISANNNTAWKSIEKAINRKPFILKNKRMYEGKCFTILYDEKWTVFRCTGWNEKGNIKFVTDNKNEKQKRFSFDIGEFKAFFKAKKFRD